MLRNEPIGETPPATYKAWNTDESDEIEYVPGAETSPRIFTCIPRSLPKETFICVSPFTAFKSE